MLQALVHSLVPKYVRYEPLERPPPGTKFAELKAINLIKAMNTIYTYVGTPPVFDQDDALGCTADEQVMLLYLADVMILSFNGAARARARAVHAVARFVARSLHPGPPGTRGRGRSEPPALVSLSQYSNRSTTPSAPSPSVSQLAPPTSQGHASVHTCPPNLHILRAFAFVCCVFSLRQCTPATA